MNLQPKHLQSFALPIELPGLFFSCVLKLPYLCTANIIHLFLKTAPLFLHLRTVHSLLVKKFAACTFELKSFSLSVSIAKTLTGEDRRDEKDIFNLDSLLCFLPPSPQACGEGKRMVISFLPLYYYTVRVVKP